MKTADFEPLRRLFHGDAGRVRQLLGVFAKSLGRDLEQLDTAYEGQDWSTVRLLAHKLKSGCEQIGEMAAARGLAAIELRPLDERAAGAIAEEFAITRLELDNVMIRVATYLKSED
ncbi:Hpt domain-containing protein [Lysobacter capsici]|uniref:Hpt domain-containing protein n=1 Tax=Lysobacter capsici TaxID=435897 RepID=UPI00071645E4|nr:Hpt domain-containing protein [Lysobacter capsici]